uniref:Uncharacterized protein n=1 Tax=Arundo donax TaxID=35708 RepID=A0A0A9GQD4_ARUDO
MRLVGGIATTRTWASKRNSMQRSWRWRRLCRRRRR